jgi:fibronectin-binding autotransporter adhesin
VKPKFPSLAILSYFALAVGGAPLATAQWNGIGISTGTGGQDIASGANWTGGTINGDFTNIDSLGDHNLVLSGGLTFTSLNFDTGINTNTVTLGTVVPGSGYTAVPPVTVTTTGLGTGATATATISGTAVNAINITSHGSGYYTGTLPTFVVAGTGSGAGRSITGVLPLGATNITINSDTEGVKRIITLAGTLTPQDRSDSSLTFGADVDFQLSGNSIIANGGGNFNAGTVISFNGDVLSTAAGTQSLTKNHAGTVIFGAGGTVNLDGGYSNTLGTSTFNGRVEGIAGVSVSGGGVVNFNDSGNTFSGAVSINSGTINTALIARAGEASGIGTGGSIVLNGTATLNVTGTGSQTTNRSLSGNTTVTLRNNGTGTTALNFTGGTFTSTNTAAATLRLGGTNNTSVNIFSYDVANSATNVTRHLQIGADGGDVAVWRVTGNNTFTGNMTVSRGTMEFTSAANLGGGTNAIVLSASAGTNFRYVGTGDTNIGRSITWGGHGGAGTTTITANGIGTLTLSGATMTASNNNISKNLTLTGFNTGENTISANILRGNDGTGSSTTVNKTGASTWVLSGANTVGAGNEGVPGALNINNGRLVLDYSVNDTVWGVASNVAMTGSTLEIRGRSGAENNTSLTLGNFSTATNSGLSTVLVNRNGGNSTTLTMGSFSRSTGSAILFDLSSGGKVINANTTNSGGLFSSGQGHFFVRTDDTASGVDYASKNDSSEVIALGATAILPASGGSGSTNYAHTGSLTLTGNTSVNVVRIDSGGGGSLEMGTSNFVTSNGALFVGSGDYAVNGSGVFGASNGTTIINYFGTGTLTLGATMGTGTLFLVNGGGGLVNLTSAASSTGAYQFIGGTVRVGATSLDHTNANTADTAGTDVIRLSSGGVMELQADLTRDLGGSRGGVGMFGSAGFSAFGGNRNVSLNTTNEGNRIIWGAGSFVADNLILGSAFSDSTVTLTNDISFGLLSRVVEARDGIVSGDIDGRLGGVLSSTGGGLVKKGTGTLQVTGANTYTGDTWVLEGGLSVSNTSGSGTGTGDVRLSVSTTLSGTGSISGVVSGSGTVAPGASPGILTVGAVNASEGLSFLFEMTALDPTYGAPTASGNDVLRITSATPFLTSLSSTNNITVDFTSMTLNPGDVILGAFYAASDFSAAIQNATYTYMGADGLTVNVSVVSQNADFGAGMESGFVTRFDIIPEPASALLAVLGATGLFLRRRRDA